MNLARFFVIWNKYWENFSKSIFLEKERLKNSFFLRNLKKKFLQKITIKSLKNSEESSRLFLSRFKHVEKILGALNGVSYRAF